MRTTPHHREQFSVPATSRGHWTRLAVGLLLAACAVGAGLSGAVHDALWQDEVGTERVISQSSVRDALHVIVDMESTPPAFFLLARAADRAATGLKPETRVKVTRVALPLALSAGCAVLTFMLALELMPLWAAILAGLLVSFGPIGDLWGPLLRAYSMLAFTCVAFAFALERAAARPGLLRLALLSGVVALGSLTHYFFLFTLGAGVLWLLIARLRGSVIARIGAAVAIGLIPLALWSPDWLRQYRHGIYATAPPFNLTHFLQLLPLLFTSNAIVSSTTIVASTFLTLTVLVSAALLLRPRQGRLCALFVLVPFLTVSLFVWVSGELIYRDRNLIGVAPFAAIALAWGVASLPWRRVSHAAAAVVLALVIAQLGYGEIALGRTPYDRIAATMIRQGFRRQDPILWFGGGWAGPFSVGWYLTSRERANTWPRLVLSQPSDGACGRLEVIARSATGRLWLSRHREAILTETSLPAYGDVPEGRRNHPDMVIARLRWHGVVRPGTGLVAGNGERPKVRKHWFLIRVAGAHSPCRHV